MIFTRSCPGGLKGAEWNLFLFDIKFMQKVICKPLGDNPYVVHHEKSVGAAFNGAQ